MKNSVKNIITLILISVALIFIGYLGSVNSKEYYSMLILPDFAPPSWLFPIAWGIIYALMILSAVIIEKYVINGMFKKDALGSYWLQLIINVIWPWLFFVLKFNLLSFVWIVVLFIFVFITFKKFYRLNKLSGILLIPYLIWLVYAAYINLGVFILN